MVIFVVLLKLTNGENKMKNLICKTNITETYESDSVTVLSPKAYKKTFDFLLSNDLVDKLDKKTAKKYADYISALKAVMFANIDSTL